MADLPKTFDPAEIEARWYAHWEETGQFRPDRPGAEPWTIVNPPPNVTGSLHIGHALDNTLQDILTRHARLKGKDALWVVGTDHAGIATQMVVERQMAAHQQKRTDFTREDFVEKVWDWKAESGGEITRQLRRLGCSMDWANERFTMDPGFSKAVLKVFVDLYNEGLLYRDKRLVNWDPGLGTAISDLEVETREVQGKFWHLRYPLEDGSGHISVATTRPETMLADMAVAVNPSDERYAALVGRQVRLPITGRLVPIIADDHADPELGSGAVKITPGHDFNDFEVGKRAGFKAGDMLNMLDAKARVTQTSDGLIPADLLGVDRFWARKLVVERLEAEGFLERVEDRVIQTPYGDRSGEVIEPWLTDQWYVDAATLAKPAIEAVKSGAIRIVPKTWEKTFFNWMENIQPWCVSRQLWWGHRIPAWFGPGLRDDQSLIIGDVISVGPDWRETTRRPIQQKIFVALNEQDALEKARAFYPEGTRFRFTEDVSDRGESEANTAVLHQDPDVLDTWFSSALWPFATMGWPGSSPSPLRGEGRGEGQSKPSPADTARLPTSLRSATLSPEGRGVEQLAGRYPNDVLISGFDILFFWDARMMMQGIHFMGDVPFRTLYLHGLVRAADGAKMSKSKGNTVDPLGLIDRYGADALRFFMAAMESQGRDIKMDEKRVEGYRNFATKLWNAARFCQVNGVGGSTTLKPPPATLAVNKWIVGECVKAVQAVDLALAEYRFDAAANAIYQFVWSQFCDWYVELIKPVLGSAPSSVRPRTGSGAAEALPSSEEESAALRQAQGERGEDGVHETKAVAGWVLDQILVVLHPFMPFITEELWHALAERENDLIVAQWPMADARVIDVAAVKEIEWLIRLLSTLREVRAEVNMPPGARPAIDVRAEGTRAGITDDYPSDLIERFARNRLAISRIGRVDVVTFLNTRTRFDLRTGERESRLNEPKVITNSVPAVVDGDTYWISAEGVIDLAAERERIQKAIAAAEKERDSLAARLANPSFVERAKPEAVEKAKADHADKAAEAERLSAALARLR